MEEIRRISSNALGKGPTPKKDSKRPSQVGLIPSLQMGGFEGDRVRTDKDDFYNCIRPFLLFSSWIGIVPLNGLGQHNFQLVTFKKMGLRSIINLLIIASMLLCVLMCCVSLFFEGRNSVGSIINSATPIIFYTIGLFAYSYMYRNSGQLLSVIQRWQEVTSNQSVSIYDKRLKRDVKLIFGIIFVSAISENLLQQSMQASFLSWLRSTRNTSAKAYNPLESYFNDTKSPNWALIFPYNPLLSFLMFLWNKFALYSWNFVDCILIIFSRALYFKFSAIAKYTRETAVPFSSGKSSGETDVQPRRISAISLGTDVLVVSVISFNQWETITKDFEDLYDLLLHTNNLLSPLMFTSYGVNLFFSVIRLQVELAPNEKSESSDFFTELYNRWAFFHIVVRMFFVSLYAARIPQNANDFFDLFRKCPNECYSQQVSRVERFSKMRALGLSGLHCFTVTKPFMLSLINVVLTFEIVLLQMPDFKLT